MPCAARPAAAACARCAIAGSWRSTTARPPSTRSSARRLSTNRGTPEQPPMPTYAYEALNAQGKPQSGVVEAGSSEEAVQRIKSEGYFPTSVREQKVKGDAKAKASTGKVGKKKKKGISLSLGIGR